LITAGARYDRLDIDNTLTFSTGMPHVDDSFDELSPRLSAIYQLTEGDDRPEVSLYATYSEAFLPPRRPSQLRPADIGIELEPEDIENWELGLKGTLLDRRLAVSGGLFKMNREGIVHSIRQGPFFLPSNAGEHEYEGFEASLQWSALPRFTAFLNAALYHNRFGDFVIESSGGTTDLTGNRLPSSPDQVWNAGTVVHLARSLDVMFDVKYVGDAMIDNANTFELDDYTLVDAAVSWTREPVRLTLAAHNLFDEDYFQNGDTSTGESADPGQPRQVLLTASFAAGRGR
jgi:outer membrane receptor protein involved in Fe transport